ncbi:exonuclease [Staphylococcus phage vB_SscM-1]|uniref:Exonuclease n=2 Tax=Sciuriunavirus SscM1 TaxID=2734053 RepID=A0A1X9I9U0_9CAUD|nr:exonuclease [Staphylococcus phage vB_SscM-1]ANT44792.1 exonuclease [Staphylococcus phage vB_SscM-1]ANT44994.1 exonuclease [Staphylococcus phage vB_SscM-2]
MKFLFFTDSHFHLFTNYAKPDEQYENDRFREQIEALQKVFDIAKEEKATVIFGGDLFHKRNAVNTKVYNSVFSTFAKNQDVQVLLLRGNHDATTNSLYTDSSIDTFDYLPNVDVIKSLSTVTKDNVNIVFTAYGDETKEIKSYIKNSYDKDMVNILVSHLGVEGSLVGKGSHRLEGAFGYQDLQPDLYDFILLGHYHRRQYFSNPNHLYGGSLMQQSFSDEQEANGVHLIDTGKMTTEFIPIETRKFITVQGDNIPENIDELVEQGHFIRFIGTPEQAKALELDEVESNVQVQMKKKYTVEKRIDSEVTDDPVTIASSYADKYYPEAKDKIVECLKEVL